MVKRFYADLLRDGRRDGFGGLAPRTVQYVGVVLGRAMEDAGRQNVVARNPVRGIKKPRRSESKMQTWTASELRAFLDHVRGDRLYAAWLLAATTGMRRSEVLALQWRDVDLKKRRVAVRRALVLVGHEPVMREAPKTASSRRSVALDAATVAALRDHRRRQLEERLAAGKAWQDVGLVFCREDGSLINPERFSRWFESRARAAGLPTMTLRGLRHSHASL